MISTIKGENTACTHQTWHDFYQTNLSGKPPTNMTIVASGGCSNEEDVLCSDPEVDVTTLRSNHEEADARFVLHAVNLNRRLVDNIVVSARDTDVIILLLAHLAKLRSSVWIWAGTSKKPKYILLCEVIDSLPSEAWSTLLPFHTITGCNTISFISSHSKKTAWKISLDHFQLLSSIGEDVVSDAAISSAELFFA